jgi:hypothetical protein
VNRLSPHQQEIARILFSLPESGGFALAGGAALAALGIVDRQTRDIDAFAAAQPGDAPGDVGPLVDRLARELVERGWEIDLLRRHATFARLVATRHGEATEVDLAIDTPPLFVVGLVDGVPTLEPRDLAARKVLAILDRAEGRDFTDLWHLSSELGRASCVDWAKQLDAGISRQQIATAFSQLDRLKDEELPCDDDRRPTVRSWFAEWTEELRRAT